MAGGPHRAWRGPLLSPYGEQDPVYLRPVSPGDPAQPDIGAALDAYRHILTLLEVGYQLGDRQNQQALTEARTAMFALLLMRDAVADSRTPPETCAALARVGVADTSARALVAWAMRVGAVG